MSNGGRLVYVPGPSGANASRSVVWVDRNGRIEPLGLEPGSYLYPRMSPDGERVALDARD